MTWLATLLVLLVIAAETIVFLHTFGQVRGELQEISRQLTDLHGLLDWRLGQRSAPPTTEKDQ